MNYLLAANNAISSLAGAITNTATAANLESGSGALFPNPQANQYFVGTFIDAATGLVREIVWVTARTGDTITMVRGQEGTVAVNWLAGDLFQNLWTAGMFATLVQPAQYSLEDTGVANSIVVTFTPAPASWAALENIPFLVQVGAGNTNTSSDVVINANGLGDITMLLADGSAPPVGSIVSDSYLSCVYNGTNVLILSGATASVVRTKLTENTTFYVSPTGNDANNGLTAGTAWLTLQGAWNNIALQYDMGGFTATVQVADGTFTGGLYASVPAIGGTVIFQGDLATPANCIVSTTNAACFEAVNFVSFQIQGFTLQAAGATAGARYAVIAERDGSIQVNGDIVFGACTDGHVLAANGGSVFLTASYTISGAAAAHVEAAQNGVAAINSGITVTITGTPAFGTAFAFASNLGSIFAASVTFSGSATGSRYDAAGNGVIYTDGGGASYFPGSSSGSTATGGQYI